MSSSHEHRIMLLEGKFGSIRGEFETMQKELNQVLDESHVTMEGLAKLSSAGLKSLQAQVDELKAEIAKLKSTEPVREGAEGVEL